MLLNELSMVLIGMNIGTFCGFSFFASLIKMLFLCAGGHYQRYFNGDRCTERGLFNRAPLDNVSISFGLRKYGSNDICRDHYECRCGFVMSNHILRMLIIQSIPSIAFVLQ